MRQLQVEMSALRVRSNRDLQLKESAVSELAASRRESFSRAKRIQSLERTQNSLETEIVELKGRCMVWAERLMDEMLAAKRLVEENGAQACFAAEVLEEKEAEILSSQVVRGAQVSEMGMMHEEISSLKEELEVSQGEAALWGQRMASAEEELEKAKERMSELESQIITDQELPKSLRLSLWEEKQKTIDLRRRLNASEQNLYLNNYRVVGVPNGKLPQRKASPTASATKASTGEFLCAMDTGYCALLLMCCLSVNLSLLCKRMFCRKALMRRRFRKL